MMNITRTANATSEQVICTVRAYLWLVVPELTTTGTLTIRNGAGGDTKHVAAIGLGQAGKMFGGALFEKGITIQQSVGTDQCAIIWEAA